MTRPEWCEECGRTLRFMRDIEPAPTKCRICASSLFESQKEMMQEVNAATEQLMRDQGVPEELLVGESVE